MHSPFGPISAALCTSGRHYVGRMPLTVIDQPADRPEWIRETIRLVADRTGAERAALLARVESASDADLGSGTDSDWGLGQIAVHLLVVERGVAALALRLARGEAGGPTGQPRPAAAEVSREGILALGAKAAAAQERLLAEFPADPDDGATAVHPFYGRLNCFGWLLTLPNHYTAHLTALREGRGSAL